MTAGEAFDQERPAAQRCVCLMACTALQSSAVPMATTVVSPFLRVSCVLAVTAV